MLETLERNSSKVKDLTLEPARKEVVRFHPERDIDYDKWLEIRSVSSRYRSLPSWDIDAVQIIASLKILDNYTNFPISDVNWRNILTERSRLRKEKKFEEIFTWSYYLSLIGLNRDYLSRSDKRKNKFREKFSKVFVTKTNVKNHVALKVSGEEINSYKDERWKKAAINQLNLFRKRKDPDFLNLAYRLSILWPDIRNEITNEDWEGLRKSLKNEKDISKYIVKAANMKILAANEFKITQHGVEIQINSEEFLHLDSPMIPERRKF